LHRRCVLVPLIPFLWPALAAATATEIFSALTKELAHLPAGHSPNATCRQPRWTTPNQIALELPSMRLRKFSADGDDIATLVCAPLALHDATLTDFAPDHSLVAALQRAGLRNVFVTDWRSATPEMRFFSIDSYLADLNVVVDELGGYANLIGVCQGGWMALAYAARYPSKIRGLVLAGAPIDINAGESTLSRAAYSVPPSGFKQLVELGDGRVRGTHLLQFWKHPPLEPEAIHNLLQISDEIATQRSSRLITLFREWYERPIDLPGTYYLQVVQWLYKDNQLATGRFAALGRPIDLSIVRGPIFLLAARDDEIVAPEQLLAARHLVGSEEGQIRTEVVPGTHLGLCMGATTLLHTWSKIARWLAAC
jgi:poly(3-hydroxybutyrate) depolymerase